MCASYQVGTLQVGMHLQHRQREVHKQSEARAKGWERHVCNCGRCAEGQWLVIPAHLVDIGLVARNALVDTLLLGLQREQRKGQSTGVAKRTKKLRIQGFFHDTMRPRTAFTAAPGILCDP